MNSYKEWKIKEQFRRLSHKIIIYVYKNSSTIIMPTRPAISIPDGALVSLPGLSNILTSSLSSLLFLSGSLFAVILK